LKEEKDLKLNIFFTVYTIKLHGSVASSTRSLSG